MTSTKTKSKTTARKNITIVVSRFNEHITQRLLDGCLAELKRQKFKSSDYNVVWVPGAFEIPVTALKAAKKRGVDAVICLGAVIRGETFHYELVAMSAAQGIVQASLITGKPIVFGVLATETVMQAESRAEVDGDNKGREAAITALEMIAQLKAL